MTINNRKISFWCLNHETPVEMIIQQGMSPFYACPKFSEENRGADEKPCLNRMTMIDAGGIIERFAAIISEEDDPFNNFVNYYNYSFTYKGGKSKITVKIIKYNDDEIRFGIRNNTALDR